MLVKNCKVYDGGEEGVLLIDERGYEIISDTYYGRRFSNKCEFRCPIKTSVIQSPPSYDETLTMAFAPVFAFSFPDRTQMNFRFYLSPS